MKINKFQSNEFCFPEKHADLLQAVTFRINDRFKPICSQCTLSQPPENRKPYGFLMFSRGEKGASGTNRLIW